MLFKSEPVHCNFDVLDMVYREIENDEVHRLELEGINAISFKGEIYVDPHSPQLNVYREWPKYETDHHLFGLAMLHAEVEAWDAEFERAMSEYSRLLASRQPLPRPLRAMRLLPSPKEGFVYLISGDHGRQKIGRTGDLVKRLAALKSASGLNLEVVTQFQVKDTVRAENFLHGRFADQRTVGEWFNLSEESLNWLLSIDAATLERLTDEGTRTL